MVVSSKSKMDDATSLHLPGHLPAESYQISWVGNRSNAYELLAKQVERLLDGPPDLFSDLGNIVAILKTTFDFYWIGFYLREGNTLLLRQFQGPVACSRIEIPNGVCGSCVARNSAIIVCDVEQFPGHIACSTKSRSEIVIPLRNGRDPVGVLDLDSTKLDDFSTDDQSGLERIVGLIEAKYFSAS